MIDVLKILDLVIPFCHAVTFFLYGFQFARERETTRITIAAAVTTVIVHVAYFGIRTVALGYLPLGSKAEFLSLTALSIISVYLLLEFWLKQGKTGVFFSGVSMVSAAFAAATMVYTDKHALLLENPIYGIHVMFMVFGFTALAVGATYGAMFLLMANQLKSRELGVFFKRLPPLMELQKMTKVATVVGVALLALGFALGYVVAFTVEDFPLNDPKLIASDIILIGYIGVMIVAKFRGLSGTQIAYGTIVGFSLFIVSAGVLGHTFS